MIASSILVQCHSISEHGQLSFMNQHQTHRLCARIHAAIELPLAASLLKQQQSASSASLEEVNLIKLKVHLESAVRLVREQVGVRSLSGLLLYQTQAKEFQVINANLAAAAVKEAGLSSYVNNEKENVEDERKDRELLAQLAEAAKSQIPLLLPFLEESSFP